MKTILICGMRDDCLDMLNIIRKGEISKEDRDDICELCRICSRGTSKNRSRGLGIYATIMK